VVIVMLICGGLAGLAGASVILGRTSRSPADLRDLRHRRHHGRTARACQADRRGARRAAVRLAQCRKYHDAGPDADPVDIATVIQALIVLFVAAPPFIRELFHLRARRVARKAKCSRRGGAHDGHYPVGHERATIDRQRVVGAIFAVLGLVDIFVFGLLADKGDAVFTFTLTGAAVNVPNLTLAPVRLRGAGRPFGRSRLCLCRAQALQDPAAPHGSHGDARVRRVLLVLVRCRPDSSAVRVAHAEHDAGRDPAGLGALSGCLCERSGVINIAIEASCSSALSPGVIASAFGSLWLDCSPGRSRAACWASCCGIRHPYMVDQIILGVVLNVFASGLTGYLYDQELVPFENRLNSPATFNSIKIPILGDIPVIGPILFDSTIFLYIAYAAVALVHIGLFKTRWGCGSGPSVSTRRRPTPWV